MKQLKNFLRDLQISGFNSVKMWEQKLDTRPQDQTHWLVCYTIARRECSVTVLFHTFGENDGFTNYIESQGTDFHESKMEIIRILENC